MASDSVFVFVDNSNLWIEGKKISGRTQNPSIPSNGRYRIEFGRLLTHVIAGRSLGAVPKLYGSEPPQNDSVWRMVESKGFDVSVFRRNIFGKEKGVDMRMGLDIQKLILTHLPKGTMILIAGDADFVPVVDDAKAEGWVVEIWYWSNAAVALQSAANVFHNLDPALNLIGFEAH